VCQRLLKLGISSIITPPGAHLGGLVRSVSPDAIVVRLDSSPLETRVIVNGLAAMVPCPVLVLAPWRGIFSPRNVTSCRGVRVLDAEMSNTALIGIIAAQLAENAEAAAEAVAPRILEGRVDAPHTTVTIGDCVVDLASRSVVRDGDALALSPTECTLLGTLLAAGGAAVPYAALFRALKGVERDYCRLLLAQAIHRLREKLGESPRRPRQLITVYGYGYRLVAEGGEERAAG
jgi:DNA-binding winged helix-turn-helix (wHTH) protein